jgi:hypothetical protein
VDAAKAKAEENLDGKYLLRTADPKLYAEDRPTGAPTAVWRWRRLSDSAGSNRVEAAAVCGRRFGR